MQTIEVFEKHAAEYDQWYDKYPFVFESEVEAIKAALPEGKTLRGIEIGLGTGRFCQAIGIKQGVEPSFNMRKMALKRGIEVMDAVAERLPYKDLQFDFVLMTSCIIYFDELLPAFKESFRVLKKGGTIVIGFIEKNSLLGKKYEERRPVSTFYKNAKFYSARKVIRDIRMAGFKNIELTQTLFHNLDDVKSIEETKPGYGEGSFVVLKAIK